VEAEAEADVDAEETRGAPRELWEAEEKVTPAGATLETAVISPSESVT